MGGYFYQSEALHVVDYQLYQLEGSDEYFRGPQMNLVPKKYIAYVGAAQTFGTFCRHPFPSLVGERVGLATANLGIGGAGPSRFLSDPPIMEVVNDARLVVVQVMSGRSSTCRIFESLRGGSTVRRIDKPGSQWMWAEQAWEEVFKDFPEKEIESLVEETRARWVQGMLSLLDQIKVPKILLWASTRSPDYNFSLQSAKTALGPFPHFVNRAMVNEIRPRADSYVEAVSSRGSPQPLFNRFSGDVAEIFRENGSSKFRMNGGYPSPEMHADFADVLTPIVRETLSGQKRTQKTASASERPSLGGARVAVLLCHERAGSHLLKHLLASHPGIFTTGEVCNYAATGEVKEFGFHSFRNMLFQRRPDLMAPTPTNNTEVLDEYFSMISREASSPAVVVDIKYAHVPNFNPFWSGNGRIPEFLGYLRKRKIPVIHLYRNNAFEAVVSGELAISREIWVSSADQTQTKSRLSLDRQHVACRLRGLAGDVVSFKYYVQSNFPDSSCTLRYEDLISETTRVTYLNRIVSLLGLSSDWTPTASLKKVSPPVSKYLENYEALRDLAERFSDVDGLGMLDF